MKKVLDYILGGIYLVYFGLLLVVFHPIQAIAYHLFGRVAHQKTVNLLNFFIVYGLYITGSSVKFTQKENIPTGRTIVFVSNHQSLFDIPSIIWFLRKHTPIFISKKELGHGIPSISYNLRKGQAALIDRKDSKQAIAEIIRFAKHITKYKLSAAIFPEGTRSRTNTLKPFAVGGVGTLLKKCPEALVVPIAVINSGKFNPKGLYPLASFTKMSWNTLEVIDPKGLSAEEVVRKCEKSIKDFLIENV